MQSMNYTVVEKCGCGAVLTIDIYSTEGRVSAAKDFRTGHQHIAPTPAVTVVERVRLGRPRTRRTTRR